MPLTREQQRNVLKAHGLTEYEISYDRYNYKFNGKVIITQLHKSGNGYIWGRDLNEQHYKIDDRGWINIKNIDEDELSDLIKKAKGQAKFKSVVISF